MRLNAFSAVLISLKFLQIGAAQQPVKSPAPASSPAPPPSTRLTASQLALQELAAPRAVAAKPASAKSAADANAYWDANFEAHTGTPAAHAPAPARPSKPQTSPAPAPATATAPTHEPFADPATVRRVHAWVQNAQHAEPAETGDAAAGTAVRAADSAMSAGDVPSDPVLWSARVVSSSSTPTSAPTSVSTSAPAATPAPAISSPAGPQPAPASASLPAVSSQPIPPPAVRFEASSTAVPAAPAAHTTAAPHAAPIPTPSTAASPATDPAASPRPDIIVIDESTAQPAPVPAARSSLAPPPPLYGSREILIHQNQMADRDGLARIPDDAALLSLVRIKKLVSLPESAALLIDPALPANRRYARPWTAEFLAALSRDFYARFHSALQVNSAVRTVAVQQQLERTNGNAAPAEGDHASPHLTGEAVDLAKHNLKRNEIDWLRAYLQPLINQSKIDVEEEFQQSCFHVSVYKAYMPPDPDDLADLRDSTPATP